MKRFVIKGLFRDRSRSLFPVMMVSAGVFLTVLMYSYVKGVIGDMVDAGARFDTGHVKVVTREYHELSDQFPNDLALLNISGLVEKLKKEYPDMIWTARIRFGGLLDIPDQKGETRVQSPVFGMGVDFGKDGVKNADVLRCEKALVSGRLPERKNEILVSHLLAGQLAVSGGDEATLISSTMYGSMSITGFRIVGTLRFGMQALDRNCILADFRDIQAALDMEDGAGEILGFTRDMVYNSHKMKQAAKRFNEKFSDNEKAFQPVMKTLEEQGIMGDVFKLMNSFGLIIVSVFIFAMAVVLWNAGLMNGIRRYGEIGVRLAMGEPKGRIYRWMIFESFCIGIAGSVVGTFLGLALAYWLQYVGFDISSMVRKSSVLMSNVIRAQVTPISYLIGFVPGVIASVSGSVFAGIGIYKRQTSQLFKELET